MANTFKISEYLQQYSANVNTANANENVTSSAKLELHNTLHPTVTRNMQKNFIKLELV